MSPLKTELPKYTLAQEISNSITHGFGALLALIFGPFLIVKAAVTKNPLAIVSVSLFIASIIVTYTISCIYHALARNNGKRVLRVLDHDMIYTLIAGTYAPYCLVGIAKDNLALGWTIYGICVVLGIIGVVLNSVNLKKFKVFCMIDYIAMGWIVIFSFFPLINSIGWFPASFILLLGGISYTVGAVLYAIGSRHNQWFHLVFHCFCLLGTILMFVSIYFFVIP